MSRAMNSRPCKWGDVISLIYLTHLFALCFLKATVDGMVDWTSSESFGFFGFLPVRFIGHGIGYSEVLSLFFYYFFISWSQICRETRFSCIHCLHCRNTTLMKTHKLNKHHRPCQVNGVSFVPLVVETLGGWDTDAIFHLRAIAKQSAARSPLQAETATRQLFQRLSVLLQRANAGLIASRAPPPPPPYILGV